MVYPPTSPPPHLQDYLDIVKRPMDMGTVKRKLEHQTYSCAQECVEEFRLVFHNCCLYNKPTDVSRLPLTSRTTDLGAAMEG